jgi:hypothetical protein
MWDLVPPWAGKEIAMQELGRLARLWMAVLVLALVVGPGLVPAGAEGLVQDGHASLAMGTIADGGAADSLHGPSSGSVVPSADVPPGTDAGWWATVQEDIRQSEYHVTWQERTYLADLPAAYQAPNRAHNLRTYFAPEGVRVIPRVFEGETPPWEWGLTLTGYGYAGEIQPVGAATLHSEANRIEYRRDLLTEWYVNDERGLEQGFTLHAPPQPAGEGSLVLELALGSDLSPQLVADGTAVEFITSGGVRVLSYGELAVEDAAGRHLSAHLELEQEMILISFDASGALYPITVDPLTTSPIWTTESNQEGARLGASGTAGDVNGDGYSDVIVGAYLYDLGENAEGRAYVYHGSATGLATTPAWTVEGNQEDARLGASVGTAGDVNGDGCSDVIVGVYLYDNDQTDEGRATIYLGGADGLSTSPAWSAEGNQAGAHFGDSVGTAGDVNDDGYDDVIVGAPLHDHGENNEGRAYVYLGGIGGPGTSPAWTAESNQDLSYFGFSVGTAGDVNDDSYSDVIVGAYGYTNDQSSEGRAYVYYGGAAGLSTSPAWQVEGNQDYARLGSVGTAGDVNNDGYSDVIVGARDYDNGQTNEGRAYVYFGSAGGLSTIPGWTAESNGINAYFGRSVGTAGDVNGDGFSDVIVGAPGYSHDIAGEGRAYVYLGSADGLGSLTAWMAEGNQGGAAFGSSVGTAGDVNGDGYSDVIVGAPFYENGQDWEGRAFVYHGGMGALSAIPDWSTEGNQDGARLGWSVGTAGDVNYDGYSDVIVSAPCYDSGQSDEGAAFVYLGSATGLATSAAWMAEGIQDDTYYGTYFGWSVGTAGDVNDDGYSDVIVGVPHYSSDHRWEGRVYVYYGSPSGLSTIPDWTAEDGNQNDALFGWSVGTAGDVNNDLYSDVIVGAYGYSAGDPGVFLYLGSATGLGTSPAWTADDTGKSVATAGDVNGDHYSDVIVSGGEARVCVYHGSVAGLTTSPAWTPEGGQTWISTDISVGTAGDVNGDNYSDVIVGVPYYDNGQAGEGAAFVYLGSATGLTASAAWTAEGDQDGAHLGYSVGTAGDVNGDFYSDVIIGTPEYVNGETDGGRVFVYLGGATGPGTSGWTAGSRQAGAEFGASVATAGDVNNDGYSDIIVGAPGYDGEQSDEGGAYVYLGCAHGPGISPAWTAEGNQDGARLGTSVGTAGDVNGDGYSDVIVGAPEYDIDEWLEGVVYVYHGSPAGLDTIPAWTARGDQNCAFFGISVGTAGDVNGDGYSDVIVGKPASHPFHTCLPSQGRVYVYHGSALGLSEGHTGLDIYPDWSVGNPQDNARFGWSVGTAGDVNGDGYSDVIVGAPEYDIDEWGEGRAYVYHGGAGGLSHEVGWQAGGNQGNANFGTSVGTAGDVNGDGYGDVIVGAYRYDNDQADVGQATVYHGGTAGLGASPAWAVEGNQDDASFGFSVGTAGDVNGDGYSDVIVGAYGYSNGQSLEGATFVYYGSAGGLTASPAWTAEGNQAGARFGEAVGTAGDVNGDGYSDVIVGAPLYDYGEYDEGLAYVYLGSANGLTFIRTRSEGNQALARFGTAVGTAGDVNGDGYSDVIVGAPLYNSGAADAGRARVYYGNGVGGLFLLLRQLRGDGSTPIGRLGTSDDPTSFRISLIGRMPLGRADVKLQWYAAPVIGMSFSDDQIVQGTSPDWIDTGTGGAEISQLVTGLSPDTAYHWRVRLLYRPGNALGQSASRWIHIPWGGWNETDLRTSWKRVVYLPLVVRNH